MSTEAALPQHGSDEETTVATVHDQIQEILDRLGWIVTPGKKNLALLDLTMIVLRESVLVRASADLVQASVEATDYGATDYADSAGELAEAQEEARRWKELATAATLYLPEPERSTVRASYGLPPIEKFGD